MLDVLALLLGLLNFLCVCVVFSELRSLYRTWKEWAGDVKRQQETESKSNRTMWD